MKPNRVAVKGGLNGEIIKIGDSSSRPLADRLN
jgi:hypothetical protein